MIDREGIEYLRGGGSIIMHPKGNSMVPKIRSGQRVTVSGGKFDPKKGDIVLCRVAGKIYLHLVSAVSGGRYQISNNRGRVNGWTSRENIYGKVVEVGD